MLLEVSILVQGDEANNNKSNINPMLHSVVPLSFWGGVDPLNGQVIDHTHPWYGKNIVNTVVAIPSGRGSCTGSQVMLELILNGAAPSIVITREVDPILCVAAIIAQEVFVTSSAAAQDYPLLKIPTIISVGEDGFKKIGEDLFCGNIEGQSSGFCRLLTEDDTTAHKPDNSRHTTRSAFLAFGKTEEQVRETAALGPSTNAVRQHATQSLALTPEEQSILDGTYSNSNKYQSKAHQVAMRTVVRIANIVKAKELIPITQAHIDACTYIGKGGLAFVNELVSMGKDYSCVLCFVFFFHLEFSDMIENTCFFFFFSNACVTRGESYSSYFLEFYFSRSATMGTIERTTHSRDSSIRC